MLGWLSDTYSLLSADEYQRKAIDNQLEDRDICLSLNDALFCQYDVAVPILKRKGLKAFFFVYSSPMKDEPDLLEVFRYFRTVRYSSVERFYEYFFVLSEDLLGGRYSEARQTFVGLDYLKDFPFYSENDRRFRFLRDRVLSTENYVSIMRNLMYAAEFEPRTVASRLWLTDDHLRNLCKDGHVLGLHSYTPPPGWKNSTRSSSD